MPLCYGAQAYAEGVAIVWKQQGEWNVALPDGEVQPCVGSNHAASIARAWAREKKVPVPAVKVIPR
jgi:hypothetical protein